MITEVKAYSAWNSAPTLLLAPGGMPETDLIQIRNIDGLDPVKASISTSPYGAVDGESFTGSSVPKRNIVLTLRPNPDWDNWTPETLRRLIYAYFMPKLATKLVFHSDDMDPVEISGYVEGVENNIFSKDPEFIVSIICPDPYFKTVTPTVVTGVAGTPVVIDYEGNVQTGVSLKVTYTSGANPTSIGIRMDNADASYLVVDTSVDATHYFEMSSIPMRKFVQSVNIGTGVIDNLLSASHIEEGSLWPHLHPGDNDLEIITDQGIQDWELSYYKLYGGL